MIVPFVVACAATPSLSDRRIAAAPAVAALRAADFDRASDAAIHALEVDSGNPFAAVVRAVTDYKNTMHHLVLDVQGAVLTMAFGRGFNDRYLKYAFETADEAFASIDRDLAVAAAEPGVYIELCLACWEYDWNKSGEIDDQDRRLLEIEQDANGRELALEDPRRRPTYRFDHGDILWARAFIAFHRAAVSLFRAFDFSRTFEACDRGIPDVLEILLVDSERIPEARRHILDGLEHADQARLAYLAEEDDDREWLPNPRQKDHPMPLPVDDELYATWEDVVSDVRKLVNGEEGLSIAELAQLGDHRWEVPPTGYLHVGRMFDEPTSIFIEAKVIDEIDEKGGADPALKRALGKYRVDRMMPSALLRRLFRMKDDIEQKEESIERKLRYLLWIN